MCRHVQTVEVLRPYGVGVDLVVVVGGCVLGRDPQLVDGGVVPPDAGEAVDIDHQEKYELHEVE